METRLEQSNLQSALADLSQQLNGELRVDETHRNIYATDASIYAEKPIGVVFPKDREDLETVLAFARKTQTPLIPRAAGTSLAGQVVGGGLVVDTGRFMTRILDFDPDAREARVEPGVIQDDLNRFVAPHRLLFGPDTSTGNRAMVGGMIGNNSCGAHSILYGTTREHTKAISALLADGTALELGPMTAEQVDEAIEIGGRLGEVLAGLRAIVTDVRDEIDLRYPGPDVVRRNAGYALDYLAGTVLVDRQGEPLNLARFLCGSEGTLAFVAEATVNVEPAPKVKGLMVAQFDSLSASLRAAVDAVALQPSGVELLDKAILDLTVDQLEHRHNRFFLEGDPEAILIVEFFRDTDEELAEAKRALRERLCGQNLAYACTDISPADASKVWSVRKAGLGLLMGIVGDTKPVAFVEDTAVPLARLPDYIEQFEAVMKRHDTKCVYYGHASVGELHMRPLLNLKSSEDIRKLERIAADVTELVAEYGGTISGEHGDGRVRSPYLEQAMGQELVEAFGRVKNLFDPDGLLNPGKIVDPMPVSADLRTIVDKPRSDIASILRFETDGDLMRHVERCNGAGVCRKPAEAGGTMCPSYMATREELHSTRGRTNLFRQLLYSSDPASVMASEELYDALELCLMCKGCKAECPASVDVAKLKSEFLQHYWDTHGTPLRIRAIGHIAQLNGLGSRFPRLTNAVMRNRITSGLLKRALGVDRALSLPTVSMMSMRRWFERREGGATGRIGSETDVDSSPKTRQTVALFADEFTNLQDAEVGQAAVELLEALGYRVVIPPHRESGRALISKGLIRAAAKRACDNVRLLHPLVKEGIPILGLEPSATATLIDEYPDLVDADQRQAAREVAEGVFLIENFLADEAGHRDLRSFFDQTPRRIWLHGHCHQKALVGAEGSVAALSIPAGHNVRLIEAGCCGMAGAFGYEHRELSLQVAELRLFPALREISDDDLIAAPGFSCRHQIALGLSKNAQHPIQILHSALKI